MIEEPELTRRSEKEENKNIDIVYLLKSYIEYPYLLY